MDVSIFLAKVFSVYFIVVGVGMFFNRQAYRQAALEMVESKSADLLASIITLILGILLVLFHNLWVTDWRVIITVLAWATLLKGILRMLLPVQMQKATRIIKSNTFYLGTVLFMLVLGMYLAYYSFFPFVLK